MLDLTSGFFITKPTSYLMNTHTVAELAQRIPVRLPLALLQLVLSVLLGHHIGFKSLLTDPNPLMIGLLVLLGVVLFLPDAVVRGLWAIFSLTAVNTVILVTLMADAGMIEPWHSLGFVLVILMASLGPSIQHFVGVGLVLCAVYGFAVYHFGLLLEEQGFVITVLLAMLMVLVKKTSVVEDQLQIIAAQTKTKAKAAPHSGSDALTGLPNRTQFIEHVWRSIKAAQNNGNIMFAILFIDLDGFKPINDDLGHKAGDAVLVEIGRRLRGCLRGADVAARYGGDEFTLLINNISGQSDAIRVAERVLSKVKEPILAGKRVQVGATIGIALSTNVHHSPEDLIRDSDTAMYRAKSQGKGRYEISDQLKDTGLEAGQAKTLLKVRPIPGQGA